MKRMLFGFALVALATGSPAVAGTCKIQSTREPGHWTFLKVFDVESGEVVLQKAIEGGKYREVTAHGDRVRVDWKLPGGKDYKAGPVSPCKDGNTIKS